MNIPGVVMAVWNFSFKDLTNLKDIELSEIEGLDAQIEELQKAFPDCKIL